jgi:hypothetical protein
MKKYSVGTGRKSLAALMAVMGLFSTAQSSSYVPNNQSVVRAKDSINNLPSAPRLIEKRKTFGGDNPHKHYRKMKRNQKQYRKWMKQVPQFRNSKKCRLK